jgi:hypothetical protein
VLIYVDYSFSVFLASQGNDHTQQGQPWQVTTATRATLVTISSGQPRLAPFANYYKIDSACLSLSCSERLQSSSEHTPIGVKLKERAKL